MIILCTEQIRTTFPNIFNYSFKYKTILLFFEYLKVFLSAKRHKIQQDMQYNLCL